MCARLIAWYSVCVVCFKVDFGKRDSTTREGLSVLCCPVFVPSECCIEYDPVSYLPKVLSHV